MIHTSNNGPLLIPRACDREDTTVKLLPQTCVSTNRNSPVALKPTILEGKLIEISEILKLSAAKMENGAPNNLKFVLKNIFRFCSI